MIVYELTDDENIALEAVQEKGIVYASDVLAWAWQQHDKDWSKAKATRLLSRLTKLGAIKREPRASLGWGQGWHPSAYSIIRPEAPR